MLIRKPNYLPYFINFGKNSNQLGLSHIAGGNSKWPRHFGKQGISSIHPSSQPQVFITRKQKYVQLQEPTCKWLRPRFSRADKPWSEECAKCISCLHGILSGGQQLLDPEKSLTFTPNIDDVFSVTALLHSIIKVYCVNITSSTTKIHIHIFTFTSIHPCKLRAETAFSLSPQNLMYNQG